MNFDNLKKLFYGVVLATALFGSVDAAENWLGVNPWIAAGPIAALELGGVVLMRLAEERRNLGERALPARLMSAGLAGGAVATNYFGHQGPGQYDEMKAYFFAGFSLAGYLVYLLLAAAKRRDMLRAAGKLEETTPIYGLWQWLSEPRITRRAQLLAQANAAQRLAEGEHPTTVRLGRTTSLAAARDQVRKEAREAGISRSLRERIAAAAGDDMATIAVHTYDLDKVARRLADGADYDGLTALLAADLTPAKLAGSAMTDPDVMAMADAVAPTPADDILDRMRLLADDVEQRISDAVSDTVAGPVPAVNRPRWRSGGHPRPRRMGRPQPAINVTVVAPERTPKPASQTGRGGGSKTTQKSTTPPATTADKVAAALAKKPAMTQADVAKVLGVGVRTVGRHWAIAKATANGHNHGTEQ